MDFSRTFLLQTVVSNPGYMKDNFYITIETFHIADRGEKENVHELDKKALKDRQVVFFMCLDSKVVFSCESTWIPRFNRGALCIHMPNNIQGDSMFSFRWFPLILPMMLSLQLTTRYVTEK